MKDLLKIGCVLNYDQKQRKIDTNTKLTYFNVMTAIATALGVSLNLFDIMKIYHIF